MFWRVESSHWNVFAAGQQELDHARKISYPGSDAFLVCFSVDKYVMNALWENFGHPLLRSKDSFEHVRNKWFPEVSKQTSSSANAVYVLVGTKLDLRDGVPEGMQVATQPPPTAGSQSVSTAEGDELAQQLGMHAYVECSALTQDNLKSVFDTTIKAVLAPKASENAGGCCTIQ